MCHVNYILIKLFFFLRNVLTSLAVRNAREALRTQAKAAGAGP